MDGNVRRIMTINAKNLFKYFPKRKNVPDQPFCFDIRKRTLFALVAKQNDLEECPMIDQLLEVLKEELGDKFNSEDEKLLYDKFLIMDFDDIFMPIKDDATEATRKWKEGLQNNVKEIIENGFKLKFDDHEVDMMPFDKSGNMSRNGRISFVNKEYVDRLDERLNLGMDFSKIKVILSKYYAYRGLYLSTSQRVNHKNFKLTPETVVIIKDTREASGKSFERDVEVATAKKGKTNKDWKFQKPKKYKVLDVDKPYDGEGFITPNYSKYINEALGIKGANSFQIRLPFAKGMLHEVDVKGFIEEYTADGTGEEQYLYKDAFGIERDLRKAHIFLTESMFKGKDWLFKHCKKKKIDPMKYYCEAIAKYNHGFYVSGTNLPYGHSKYTHLSYQTINTLAFDDNQFENIIDGHGKFIKEPIELLKKWDEIECEDTVTEDNEVSYYMPNWKRALFKNPSIASNKYIKEQLKNTQKSLVSKIALGKVLVEGQTRYLCRDLAPLLNSLLRSDIDVKNAYLRSLYTRFYLPQGKKNMLELKFEDYYAFFRYPHLSRNEQYIVRAFVLPEDKYAADGKKDEEHYRKYVKMYDKYFGHLTGIVMIPRGSTLPLCLGGADFDGDLVSVVLNKDVVDAVVKGVYQWQHSDSLYYYTRKLPAIAIPGTKAKLAYVPKYVEYDHIYNTFSNYIGQISNTAISIGQRLIICIVLGPISKIMESIDDLQENIIKGLGKMIPGLIRLIALVGLVVAVIKFGIDGGYATQLAYAREDMRDVITEGFTRGTVNIFYQGIVPTIINVLLIVEFIVMMITYFTDENKTKKILAIITLGMMMVVGGTMAFFMAVDSEKIKLSRRMHKNVIDIANEIFKPLANIMVVLFVILLILLLVAKSRWMVKDSVVASLISYAAFPLLLLLLENIIPLAIIIIAVSMIILVFAFGVGGESRSTGSGYSSASKSQKVTTNDSEKQGGSPKVIAKNYSDKDRFYRDKGGSGILTPQGENGICIYVDRDGALTNDHEFVCTAGEYDSGKVIIKTRTGKNVNV